MGNTKERILDVTAELFRRYGYTGTGLKQVVANANAPFGSLYHFFPGGKQQLGEEVIRRAGQMYLELVATVFDGATERFVDARVDAANARELAIFLIAALEGAFVLSRATKSTEAVEVAGAM